MRYGSSRPRNSRPRAISDSRLQFLANRPRLNLRVGPFFIVVGTATIPLAAVLSIAPILCNSVWTQQASGSISSRWTILCARCISLARAASMAVIPIPLPRAIALSTSVLWDTGGTLRDRNWENPVTRHNRQQIDSIALACCGLLLFFRFPRLLIRVSLVRAQVGEPANTRPAAMRAFCFYMVGVTPGYRWFNDDPPKKTRL